MYKGGAYMNSFEETITKFLSALKVDSVYDVRYVGKNYRGICVCGQPIEYGYKFKNIRNGLECIAGKTCAKYIFEYINID